jgi:Tol biopolymer transport system component
MGIKMLSALSAIRPVRSATALLAAPALVVACAITVTGVAASSAAAPVVTELVSVATGGTQGDSHSQFPAMSADGRYVAFQSYSANLVAGDTNGMTDVFVRDRQTGITERVNVASDGTQANHHSEEASVSDDGRYVAFWSRASNLVPGDTNGRDDVFVHDRQTGATERISVAGNGTQANLDSYDPVISGDGRYVAFQSFASNLVAGDNSGRDIFVRDTQTGTTERVSVAADGSQPNSESFEPAISPDGRYVAFWSLASNLVAGDTNGNPDLFANADLFLRDRQTGTTERISVAADGAQPNGQSLDASVSADGRYVAFRSVASNLVPGDTNGLIDVFVRDRKTGTTERINVAADGTQANLNSFEPTISDDGHFVAFTSEASNLVPDDTNYTFNYDVFLRDLQAGTLERVNLAMDGTQSTGGQQPELSADGRYIAFGSNASNLVSGDTNRQFDVFVRDLRPPDLTAPVLTLPDPVTVEATGPEGANVTYTATAADERGPDPVVDCTPASGARFGLGMTTVSCTATDDAGNSATGSFTVTVADTTAPTVTVTAPGDDSTVSGQVDLTATAADAVGVKNVRFRVDGADVGPEDTSSPYSSSWETTGLADGTYELTAVATDTAGHPTTSTQVSVTVDNDTSGPTTTATPSAEANAAGWHNTSLTLTLSATDDTGGSGVRDITYSLDEGEPVTISGDNTTVPVTHDGEHALTYFATDRTGNRETTRTLDVHIDTVAPGVDCASATETWYDHNVSLSCTATDLGSGLAQDSDASFALSTNVSAGTEDIDAATGSREVADLAGNTITAGPIGGNHVDQRPPPAPGIPDLDDHSDTGLSATDNITAETSPLLVGKALDASTVTLLVDGVPGAPVAVNPNGGYELTANALGAGTHQLSVTSRDAAGNASPESAELSLEIVDATACHTATKRLEGTALRDVLTGKSFADLLLGLGGADTLSGRDRGDCLSGGAGADDLRGGKGADEVFGGSRADRISGGSGRDIVHGDGGSDTIEAVDRNADLIYCDAGKRDKATVDTRDKVFGCERVTRK